jgi:hypothetical protein
VIVDSEESLEQASASIRKALGSPEEAELLVCSFVDSGASQIIESM